MPLNGGVRQRSARAARERGAGGAGAPEAPDGAGTGSKLRTFAAGGRKRTKCVGEFLKSMYLVGRISAPEFQEGAAAGVGSGAQDDLTRDLAKAGNAGSHRGNCHRDVMQQLNKRTDKPPLYASPIAFWDADKCEKITSTCYFLLPHEILHWVLAKADDVESFFGFGDNERLHNTFEKWKQSVGIAGDALACGLWGDAAAFHTRDQLYVVMLNILSGKGKSGKRYWLVSFAKKSVCACGCYGRCTFDAIFEVISWSFAQLLAGSFPAVRDDGQPFSTSGRVGDAWRSKMANTTLKAKAGVVQKRGDWSWMKGALGMVGWQGEGATKRCCYKCCANFTTHIFTDFREHALWRLTVLSHAQFMAMAFADGDFVSKLFQLPGFSFSYISVATIL